MAEWNSSEDEIDRGLRIRLLQDGESLSVRAYLNLLECDASFAIWYSRLLAGKDYAAFFWEHPPVCHLNIDHAAEFVLLDAPALARCAPDPTPFRSYFEGRHDHDVVSFRSLGGDALLLAPIPSGPLDTHTHLAAFVRNAPWQQIQKLWQETGRAVREHVSDRYLWVSTSGLGVAWLHVRLDSYPKYYQHAPYKALRAERG